jgi:3,4-dihydroxy 2-butanone 4-phosphate synthase/GTP cyclohydrolase II
MTKPPLDCEGPAVRRLTTARIPTRDGEFQLALYENSEDEKDHLALIHGDISSASSVLVRVHSECFTGDVLGSLRCDCGEQLNASMRMIAEHGSGVLLYLRQEGRGIGLKSKLKAYNLQDEGYDTVDANLALGHGADERDYTIGALILRDLGVSSVRLITNNPEKIEGLEDFEIEVSERVALQPHITKHNSEYLRTKVDRMRHMLELSPTSDPPARLRAPFPALQHRMDRHYRSTGRPFVTLSYAQHLDGSFVPHEGDRPGDSGAEAHSFMHNLRAAHDAILVGISALRAGGPDFSVPAPDGGRPRPVVLDAELHTLPSSELFGFDGPPPLIATNARSSTERQAELEAAGAEVIRLSCRDEAGLSLEELLDRIGQRGLQSVVVEGGADVITRFLRKRLIDYVTVTVTPQLGDAGSGLAEGEHRKRTGGIGRTAYPRLTNIHQQSAGDRLILSGDPVWEDG